MFKLILLTLTISVGAMFYYLNTNDPTYIPTNNPIALVKYRDTIYHCQDVVKTSCGYDIYCGNISYHCVNDITVEYLKWYIKQMKKLNSFLKHI